MNIRKKKFMFKAAGIHEHKKMKFKFTAAGIHEHKKKEVQV